MPTIERGNPLSAVIDAHIAAERDIWHYCLPAVVTSWNPKTQRATIQATLQHVYAGENDSRLTRTLKPIADVPVQFMSAGGFSLVCPISDGNGALGPATTGMAFFTEEALDVWKSGNGQTAIDPQVARRFDASDAVFIPGLRPGLNPIPNMPTDHATIGADAGARVHLLQQFVVAAMADPSGNPTPSASVDFVALAQKVLTELQSIATALQTHTHTPGTFINGGGAVTGASGTSSSSYSASSVAATILKSA